MNYKSSLLLIIVTFSSCYSVKVYKLERYQDKLLGTTNQNGIFIYDQNIKSAINDLISKYGARTEFTIQFSEKSTENSYIIVYGKKRRIKKVDNFMDSFLKTEFTKEYLKTKRKQDEKIKKNQPTK